MNYRKLFAFPTWAIMRVALQLHLLPDGHLWYGRSFSLADWSAHQTPVCRRFDLIFWVYFVLLGLLVAETFGGF